MKDYFGKDISSLKMKKLFLFDMDGTIYLGNRLFNGVKELLGKIKNDGGRYVFITNNSSRSVKDYVEKLQNMGIEVGEDNFFTSTQAAVLLFKEKFGKELIFAQGTKSFIAELEKNGLNVTTEYSTDAKAILVGYDTELTSEKMSVTCQMLTELDVPYYAANPDWVCPVSFGYVPDCGAMCFGYEKATGKAPIYIGKPQPTMIYEVMKKFSYQKEEVLVVGDRVYTDIASGVNAGVDTVCVLSGEVTLEEVKAGEIKPTFTLDSVKDILDELNA